MYRMYENDGFHLAINDRFIRENEGKEFIDIGSLHEKVGRIERDNIVLEITYTGFGILLHKRTKQPYSDVQLPEDQWGKVRAHYLKHPEYYEFSPSGLLLCILESGNEVKREELNIKYLDASVEALLINLYVQHVACKSAEELNEIRGAIQIC